MWLVSAKTLLWKEYRANRNLLILGLFLWLGAYVASALAVYYGDLSDSRTRVGSWEWWSLVLPMGALYGSIASGLTIAALGGNVIAGERVDRSAEFFASLPPSKAQIIAAKAIMGVGPWVCILGVNLLVVLPAATGSGDSAQLQMSAKILGAQAAAVFGVAWMFSARWDSPAIATCMGIVTPLVLWLMSFRLTLLSADPGQQLTRETILFWHAAIPATVGLLAFAAGTAYYVLRRHKA